ncbi:MAG: SAM-dependent chlorinase/fluorinase [Saprospiraceae bacterium]|nr:SAM-dependent chlorinase/fluorinase [Saprospiraceae bacterium]
MRIITLTTDLGWRDYYVAVIKGTLLSRQPDIQVVDITHDIPHYNIVEGAFVLKNAYPNFPSGTIHLVSILDYPSPESDFLVIRHDDHYFIGPNNGLFSLAFEERPEEVYRLSSGSAHVFGLKNLFAEAIAHICEDKPLSDIGERNPHMVERISLQPVVSKDQLRGTILHIDHYDNAIVNIRRELFEKIRNGRQFQLFFKRHDPIVRLSNRYCDVPVGEPLCLFNSAGLLEIALNMDKASTLLGLSLDDTIQINFLE